MHDELTIRDASTEDIPLIGFLAHEIWHVAYREIISPEQIRYMLNLFYTPDSLRRQMLEQHHHFLIAEIDEQALGFASYSMVREPDTYRLHKLYVLPQNHGKGVGAAMVDCIVQEIRSRGAQVLQVGVNRFNKARLFYEKHGFRVIREEATDIGEGYVMDDYIMQKELV